MGIMIRFLFFSFTPFDAKTIAAISAKAMKAPILIIMGFSYYLGLFGISPADASIQEMLFYSLRNRRIRQ
ncbi:MAG: hypothetical protein K6B40_03320 [Firmicutes bacterium]|nr:hypothetical protein [Bacillota bacterium]